MNVRTRSMKDYKRLAGIGMSHEEWKHPALFTEALDKMPKLTLQNARIHRMAHMLEDERMGGSTSEVMFDPYRIERLAEAAASDAHAQAALQHHHRARAIGKHAMGLSYGGGSHHDAHQAHSQAASAHRVAAKHMAASGDTHTASRHDLAARMHERHAAAHARHLGGINHTADQEPHHAPAAPAKKAHWASRLKAKIAGIGGGGVNWAEKAAATGAPVKAHAEKDPFKGTGPSKNAVARGGIKKAAPEPEHEKHAARAMRSGAGAHELGKSRDVSSERKAHAHKAASHENLHAALSAFHAGNHEKALQHFNAAIHHMNKHGEHTSDAAAQKRQRERHAAGAGPRAAVGRAHV